MSARILIVDDDPSIGEVLDMFLRIGGLRRSRRNESPSGRWIPLRSTSLTLFCSTSTSPVSMGISGLSIDSRARRNAHNHVDRAHGSARHHPRARSGRR